MKKLTKSQRAKLLPIELKDKLAALSDDVLLAAHDFLHQQMEERHNVKKSDEADK